MKKDDFNFEFMTMALGLIPIQAGLAAINPGAITSMQIDGSTGKWILSMHGGTKYILTNEDMIELEETIKRRAEEGKAIQKEAMRQQIVTQNEVINELNSGVRAGGTIIGAMPKRRQN